MKFDQYSNLVWKKNFYNKSEKKSNPILSFATDKDVLFVVDNLANYYALSLKTGDLIWKKINIAPFNSQIKVYENKIFVVDFENVLRCYSIKDGKELWNVKTDNTFIKSQKKLSLVIIDEKIIFNNSIGDITAADIKTGILMWQTPTQSSSIYESAFLLKTSDLVAENKSVFLSNNKNEFFSLNINTGTLNWQQKVNSNLRPTIIDNLIFTVTIEGFLVVLDSLTGNIIRITDIFKVFGERNREKIKPIGFISSYDKLMLSTTNGRLLTIDIATGKTESISKIDNEKISRPFVFNKKIILVKDNSIIRLN